MIADILNSAILDSGHLVQKKLHSFILTQLCIMAAILNPCLGFVILHKKNFTHSFWLNLMMAAILNSAMLDSAILHKTLTQTSSIWLKLIHSHSTWWSHLVPSLKPFAQKKTSLIHSDSTWWWQPSWILPCWIQTLPSWIQTPCYLLSDSLKHSFHSNLKTNSFSFNLMMEVILNSAILDSAILHKTLTLTRTDSNSFILTQLDDGSHLEFCHFGIRHCHLGFRHLLFSLRLTQKHSSSTLTLTQTNSIWLTRWWQWSSILPSWIQPFCTKLWPNLIQSDSKSFILTQLDDGSHLEFCHLVFSHLHKKTSLMHSHSNWWWQPSWILLSWIQPFCTKKNFTCSFWLNLMMAAILNCAMLDSDTAILDSNTLLSSLRFTQKHSPSTLTLTQTNSIWLT